ncbi:MAG: 5-oxoprolinase subunit PxpA [Cellvibrionales bacterium]|nr:5-oxoprolinase subunit PxpA [Cellvibrionales bacterium]
MNINIVDINCDLGEGKNQQDCEHDAILMPYIQRANIACGGHAGNLLTMQLSVENATKHQLKIGAHPGYPDPENFGRKTQVLDKQSLIDTLKLQIDTLQEIADKQGVKLSHVKCHGALYNDIEKDENKAHWVLEMMIDCYPDLCLVGLAGGSLEQVTKKLLAGEGEKKILREGFMDRRYDDQGFLVPRTQEGSVLTEIADVVHQATRLLAGQPIASQSGKWLTMAIDTLCLHGDNPKALSIVRALTKKITSCE